jgi:SAM-dependent methyltransferase
MTIPLIERACPLCGVGDDSVRVAEARLDPAALDSFAFASRKLPEHMHYPLRNCVTCDVIYASAAPTPEFLREAYGGADYDSSEEARQASRTYARFVRNVLGRRRVLQEAALDIGTGEGSFLQELLALGFKRVVGVEPSAAPIAAAPPTIRPFIVHDMFREDLFPPESFDLITCFQTIEHLHDPLALCRNTGSLLRPGGALILVSHNHRALSARLLGRRSPIFDIEHLQLFSPRSTAKLLERAGLSDVSVQSVFNRYPLHYWTKLFPGPRKLKQPLIAWLKTSRVGHFSFPLPAGNILTIGFKPAKRPE